jgi:RNA polymerase primary sigma factor
MSVVYGSPRKTAGHSSDQTYWNEVKNCKPLTRAEEHALARRVRHGDRQARDKLVTANLRFVVSVAKRFTGSGLSLLELISEGNIGLIEAAQRFDERCGNKFITYAVWWIRQSILKAVNRHSHIVSQPTNQVNDLKIVERNRDGLNQQLGRASTVAEVAGVAGLSRERVDRALVAAKRDMSLDGFLFEEDEQTAALSRFAVKETPLEETIDQAELVSTLRRCLAVLDKREQRIMRWYFGLDQQIPMTLEQVGKGHGLTRERVRQIRDGALEKLRQQYGDELASFSHN